MMERVPGRGNAVRERRLGLRALHVFPPVKFTPELSR